MPEETTIIDDAPVEVTAPAPAKKTRAPKELPLSGLGMIQRGKERTPPRIVIYGPEGIGKSTWAASAPHPIFLATEDGLHAIDCNRFPICRTFSQVEEYLQLLLDEPHTYRTVVLDSADWLERLIWDQLCRSSGCSSIEKVDGGYAKGYTAALGLWRKVLAKLDELRDIKKMAAILVAHAKCEKFEAPGMPAYDRYSPRLHKLSCALVCEWADVVGFAQTRMRIKVEESGFGRERGIALASGVEAGGERFLSVVGAPSAVAKNRYAITADLPLAWKPFQVEFTKCFAEGNGAS